MSRSSLLGRPTNRCRSNSAGSSYGRSRASKDTDPRVEYALTLEPYAKFDEITKRFYCCTCQGKFETIRGVEAHILEHLPEVK